MSITIKDAAGGNSITVPLPQYGYEVDHVYGYNWSRSSDGGYSCFDSGTDYDYRILRGLKFTLNITDYTTLNAFLLNGAKGRAETFKLSLGATATGFFPFGPDRGDKGDFTCRVISHAVTGKLESPYRYFDVVLDIVMETNPAYTLPTAIAQGDLQIGTMEGLRWPDTIPLDSEYGFSTDLSYDGTPYSLDNGTIADNREGKTDLICNQPNAAQLLHYLAGTGRNTDIDIVAPDNLYLFGGDIASGGTHTVKQVNNPITITHNRYNEFMISLKFWHKATA